ncbi:cell division protein ZapA [Halomonas sp. MCCC 1A17488]|uniref:Cell division protein ZapA n=1 Tax=Billgrantia sulfidoxydans TaxID=2733484 RepID=A0ABX7VXK3_9GAMM|nr:MULTISPECIES: cell division protein ZapA [Halomonas]MCE8017236.1 cell division protein ZapA [Halomonas sp. MCCC 1A17488]MCG3240569.1 cell division protein ZapA [Halomonas sp. MCCC 1A17488]QPP49577.1 cell division protein ZapA [Halomonas sp. SS10-MC5]QTP53213.1 cell division protein ZapA [Halomonas sulfidoxydans]
MSDDANRPTAQVTLLGRHYVFACNAGEERKLERAARYLDRAMQGIHSQNNLLGSERVALMAALNITHELLEVLDTRRHEEQQLDRLSERLEQAMAAAAPGNITPAE